MSPSSFTANTHKVLYGARRELLKSVKTRLNENQSTLPLFLCEYISFIHFTLSTIIVYSRLGFNDGIIFITFSVLLNTLSAKIKDRLSLGTSDKSRKYCAV